jgi:hypothetical protein
MALKRNGESRASPPRLYATDGIPGVSSPGADAVINRRL